MLYIKLFRNLQKNILPFSGRILLLGNPFFLFSFLLPEPPESIHPQKSLNSGLKKDLSMLK
jgi:hypothetical protein